MFNSGFWTVGRFAGAPIRVHWTVIILMLYFGGWEPAAWVGVALIVLVHELGHAVLVRAVNARVTEVMVYGFGGYCSWRGQVTARGRALIAWGGVLGQAVLYAIAALFLIQGAGSDRFSFVLLYTLTTSNLYVAAFNLIPVQPLDGASAWPLFGILWDDFRRGTSNRKPPAPPVERPTAEQRPPAEPGETEPSNRVTDPEEAERVFKRVYDGLLREDSDKGEDN